MGDGFSDRIRLSRKSIAGYATETWPDYGENPADINYCFYIQPSFINIFNFIQVTESQMYFTLCLSRIARYAPSPAWQNPSCDSDP